MIYANKFFVKADIVISRIGEDALIYGWFRWEIFFVKEGKIVSLKDRFAKRGRIVLLKEKERY